MLVPLKAMLEDNIFHFLGICVDTECSLRQVANSSGVPVWGNTGTTDKLCDKGVRLPHVGWNELEFSRPSLFSRVSAGSTVTLSIACHSALPDDYIIAKTEYNQPITAAINKGLTWCAVSEKAAVGLGS